MRSAVAFVATLSLAAAACVAGDDDAAEVTQAVAGTPDELAVLRFLDDASTTVAVLDDDVPLDRRAAVNLIAHRDGPDGVFGTADDDRFDDLAEVDDVAYVGASALQHLVDFARAGAWVRDGELFGTFDGVPFTVAEARAAITLVDTASAATLHDAVGLDRRAVDSIVAARPVLAMATLSDLYYVGTSMLTRIKRYVAPAACSDDAVVADLTAASAGMWLTSESDYPLEVVAWPGDAAAGASPAAMLELLGLPATTSVLVGSLDHMIERLGYSNDEAQVAALRAALEHGLTQIVVYEVGLIQVHDYIVGVTACGGLVGVTSISIET
ncbi:MAG: hypothetical protein H6709_11750 [Kofleriaceae bacterium]|nr:hypothetical protein [Kofleriaceae bacterium]MCB9572750.1 hypothetical protein [Kofleriaceae bacterium]